MSSDEERLRAAHELSSEWYWEQDTDFRFTEIVGNAHVAAGLVFERFRGKTRWEVAPDALPADQWAAHRAALEARQPFRITYPFQVAGDVEKMVRERVELARRFEPHHFKRRRPNGRIIEVRGTPITGGGFVTSYTDVTEQEQAQEALRLSEQRFRELVDMSSDWFWEQDAEFRFTLLSGHTVDEGGFRAADSFGKTRWELPIDGVSDAEWRAHRALLERPEPFHDFIYRF
jgi:PAS domain-containing protein